MLAAQDLLTKEMRAVTKKIRVKDDSRCFLSSWRGGVVLN